MPKRTCGECSACCTTHAVPDLKPVGKPAGVACSKLCAQGCGIYQTRPGSCRAFECGWLQDTTGAMPDSARPDKLGLVLSMMYGTAFGDLVAVYVVPGVELSGQAQDLIDQLASKEVIIVVEKDRRSIIGPPHEQDRIKRIMDERRAWVNRKRDLGESGQELFKR